MLARERYREANLAAILLAAAFTLCTEAAAAGLKRSAPKDADVSGVWKINLEVSEDPEEALEGRRRQARDRLRGVSTVMGPAVGGIMGRLISAVLGEVANGDPSQLQTARASLQQWMTAREQFTIEQQAQALTWKFPGADPETCKTGETTQVTLPNGNLARRRCGWDGKAFVVELKLPNGYSRNERYELADGDEHLEVTTEFKGPKGPMSSFEFKRVYDRVTVI